MRHVPLPSSVGHGVFSVRALSSLLLGGSSASRGNSGRAALKDRDIRQGPGLFRPDPVADWLARAPSVGGQNPPFPQWTEAS